MTVNEYQQKAHSFSFYSVPVVKSRKHEYELPFTYPVMGLTEEAGEVSGKFAKIIRDKKGIMTLDDVFAIEKELGDVCWMVAEICTTLGIEFEDVLKMNIEKLESRQLRGTLQGSGDER